QAMEPRAWLARRSADTDFAYELGERPMDDGVGKRAAAGMNEYAVATRMRPEREVSTKPVIDGGMQRHEAALAEFGVANEETVGREIVDPKSECLGHAQSGRGEERDERRVSIAPQRRDGAEAMCLLHQRSDLLGREDERRRSRVAGRSQQTVGWNLVTRILGVHVPGEPDDESKAELAPR